MPTALAREDRSTTDPSMMLPKDAGDGGASPDACTGSTGTA